MKISPTEKKFLINSLAISELVKEWEKKELPKFIRTDKKLNFFCYLILVSLGSLSLLSPSYATASIFNFGLIITSIFFAIDYLAYRTNERIRFLKQALLLKKILKNQTLEGFYSNYQPLGKKIQKKILEEWNWNIYPFHQIRQIVVENELQKQNIKKARILDLGGCGDHCSSLDKSNKLFVVNLSLNDLKRGGEKAFLVQANANILPLKDHSMNIIIFTEVIEHLENPFQSLKEINRVLTKDGTLILTTPNRNCISLSDLSNPFRIIEKVLGLKFDFFLPPKQLITSWRKDAYFHTSFSLQETGELLKETNFHSIYSGSYDILTGFFTLWFKFKHKQLLSKLNCLEKNQSSSAEYRYLRNQLKKLETELGQKLGNFNIFLKEIPIIKQIGGNQFIVAKKKTEKL